jgi:hypothetical protein
MGSGLLLIAYDILFGAFTVELYSMYCLIAFLSLLLLAVMVSTLAISDILC